MKSFFILTIILTLAFFNCSIYLKAQSDLSEGWEINVMNERQPPGKIMNAIGIKPGMVIGEIGAGRGRFTVYLAREVGATGKILANDIDEQALTYLEERCKKLGFKNVKTILGENDDARFPDKSIDMAIMVWVYHMIEKPDQLLINLKKSLKPGALLVILDPVDKEIDEEFHIDRNTPGAKPPTIKERIEKSAGISGFEIVRVETFLPKDFIFILKVKDQKNIK
jgi:ubiquinone/menaquinone biosynthesis C-methylase UbiE